MDAFQTYVKSSIQKENKPVPEPQIRTLASDPLSHFLLAQGKEKTLHPVLQHFAARPAKYKTALAQFVRISVTGNVDFHVEVLHRYLLAIAGVNGIPGAIQVFKEICVSPSVNVPYENPGPYVVPTPKEKELKLHEIVAQCVPDDEMCKSLITNLKFPTGYVIGSILKK